ncbi:hypothetical protein Tco_1506309 [Tanacetum coccineum]
MDLPSTYKGLMEKTYTWIKAREVATNGAPNDRRGNFKRSKKSSWDNNRGHKSRDRFSPYRGPNSPVCAKAQERSLLQKRAAFPPCERNKEKAKSSKNRVERKKDKGATLAEAPILMIRQKESYTKDNVSEDFISGGREIIFPSVIRGSNSSAPVVIKAKIFGREDSNVENGNCSFHHPRSHQIPHAKGIRTVFSTHESDKIKEGIKKVRETPPVSIKGVLSCAKAKEKVVINDRYPEQTITNGKQLQKHFKERLRDLMRSNANVFAWTHADMMRIPRTIMIKGKPFKIEHNTSACKEVEELTKAGILRKVKHQTWVANPVMVKKVTKGGGYTYKGYHQIQMAEGGEDKTAFFAEEGNLEACVDNMEIKSTFKEDMLADIKETLERSIPFFKTLKSCTDKKNIRWTQDAEAALQEMKKFVEDLPMLTAPMQGEVLIMYLTASTESISAAIFARREGEQTLTKPKKSGRVAKRAIELGKHDIVFQKRGDDNKKMPKDFLIEVPLKDNKKETGGKTDTKSEKTRLSCEWKLYTDGAASSNGSGTGLMLIDPEGKEYTYTLPRNSQKGTPFSLTYGSEAIIPIAENTLAKDDKRRTTEVTKKKERKEVASIEEAYYQNKLRSLEDIMKRVATLHSRKLTTSQNIKAKPEPSLDEAFYYL